ncbi:proton-conducting transporter transmembrane domain-containing protein [Actinokineospora diospyrosa]|uniref:NADH-Ubiquinone oxidoreductase (Complex I), chain 5 N-terminus n=1 Tax=Actinokineospora diospyrosa TaxID=103728 RepID=A0ABT1I7S7_9PSEU|nr:proton-conducting transporter membrane subunit [Actinokineospora diospyrosa]MCP2268626.1 NADH-Ubiquinone oxidoreductase (complex I), chain 5 N-terminus [Actinokineospora diospyrosa]
MSALLIAALGVPLAAFLGLALAMWFGRVWTEGVVSGLVIGAAAISGLSGVALAVVCLVDGPGSAVLGTWFAGFPLRLTADWLSVPVVVLVGLLGCLIGAFSQRYLHRDPGYRRFYLLLALFVAAVQVVVLAGTLDLLVVGWELAGLASALLIAFFHHRPGPVAGGLRAFITYRISDIGLIGAAVVEHHGGSHTVVGLLLVWAVLGKSAQFPLGGWLPRAMEGPTPSSAICYGAISVSLGPYLLLRNGVDGPAVIAVGVVTALYATLVGRAQTDIKSSLAYASMTQIAVVLVEVGLGWDVLALVHLIAHALLRSGQILRSPSLLHDHHHLEQSLGGPIPGTGRHFERILPARARTWLYRFALERGYVDAFLVDRVVGGLVRTVNRAAVAEERWVDRQAVTR